MGLKGGLLLWDQGIQTQTPLRAPHPDLTSQPYARGGGASVENEGPPSVPGETSRVSAKMTELAKA